MLERLPESSESKEGENLGVKEELRKGQRPGFT